MGMLIDCIWVRRERPVLCSTNIECLFYPGIMEEAEGRVKHIQGILFLPSQSLQSLSHLCLFGEDWGGLGLHQGWEEEMRRRKFQLMVVINRERTEGEGRLWLYKSVGLFQENAMMSQLYCLLLMWPQPSHALFLSSLSFFICKVRLMNVLPVFSQIQMLSKLTEVTDIISFICAPQRTKKFRASSEVSQGP